MKIRSLSSADKLGRSELLVAFAVDGASPSATAAVTEAAKHAKSTGDYKAAYRTLRVFHPAGRTAPKRVLFAGLGKKKDIDTERLRRVAAMAQQRAEALEVSKFALIVDAKDLGSVEPETAGRVLAEGLILGAYRYEPPRKKKAPARSAQSAEVAFVGTPAQARSFNKGLKRGILGAGATSFARDFENKAGNLWTPSDFARAARRLADTKAQLRVKVLDEREMEKLGMGSLLSVSRGSAEPAKLIVMEYGPRTADKTVCVVGKGITFDTGGISIKPSARMDEMRYDMCGGGAVLGLFHAIKSGALRDAKLKTRVVGIIAAVENMPGSKATKPGDIFTAMDGTTVEVLNTDAEGRLVLADALAYAIKNYKPAQMVDLATLTGAVIVALGHEAAGVMGTDDKLIQSLIDAGSATDERLWQLPLWPEHREQMKSKFADLANINSPGHGNGTIAGAAFLAHFAEGTPWAHIDIAGTAWGGRAKDYYRGGASGSMVRMLIEWARGLG